VPAQPQTLNVPARTRYSPLGRGVTDELMAALYLPQVFEFIGDNSATYVTCTDTLILVKL
jgi:hypothetical protein